MKLAIKSKGLSTRESVGGFTLAEVLAALAFMAIVIPVVAQALHIASLAGEVAERKSQASRVAERLLNESIVTSRSGQSLQNGILREGNNQFRWALRNETWIPVSADSLSVDQGTMNLLSVDVIFSVQSRDYTVHMSTLTSNSLL